MTPNPYHVRILCLLTEGFTVWLPKPGEQVAGEWTAYVCDEHGMTFTHCNPIHLGQMLRAGLVEKNADDEAAENRQFVRYGLTAEGTEALRGVLAGGVK